MTLQEFFQLLSENPVWILAYFLLLPIAAWLTGRFAEGEGHESPWKYVYSTLIYLCSVPGMFAIFLSAYLFLFERRSILETDIYTQVLPILSMVATLLVIRRNVDLDAIPGFEKITGLLMMIGAVLALLWVIDRTRIWVVSFLPFWQALLILAGLLLAARWGWRKVLAK
ncbi:MAG: hypothetical protein Kow0027_03940 [Saprospiraceae bacterium]